MSQKLLSAEMLAVADALRSVRARLIRLTAEGQLPEGSWPDVSTVQLLGLDVAAALERLADVPAARTIDRDCKGGAYDRDERR
ncbi:MAG TPA: hypothetical protein VH682_31820 [Gemmataceae bacterium]|jgi:hypothetical protein